jgi:hypothetical protein
MSNTKRVEVTGKAEWGLKEIKKGGGQQIEKWMICDNKNGGKRNH